MSRSLALASALLVRILPWIAQGEEPEGNPLCWESANFQDRALSFGECCGSEGAASACFDGMDGWYTFDFCCLPPAPEHENCSWPQVVNGLEEDLRFLENFPVVLREVCCVFPHGNCWPSAREGDLPEGFAECCFPGLRRMLLDPEGAGSWAKEDLEEEFRPLEGRTWSKWQLDAFAEEMDRVRETRPGKLVDLPCRIRIGPPKPGSSPKLIQVGG